MDAALPEVLTISHLDVMDSPSVDTHRIFWHNPELPCVELKTKYQLKLSLWKFHNLHSALLLLHHFLRLKYSHVRAVEHINTESHLAPSYRVVQQLVENT